MVKFALDFKMAAIENFRFSQMFFIFSITLKHYSNSNYLTCVQNIDTLFYGIFYTCVI